MNMLPQVGSLVSLEKLEEAHLRKILEHPQPDRGLRCPGHRPGTLYRKRKKIGIRIRSGLNKFTSERK